MQESYREIYSPKLARVSSSYPQNQITFAQNGTRALRTDEVFCAPIQLATKFKINMYLLKEPAPSYPSNR